jgi:serine/threonine-protein kinase
MAESDTPEKKERAAAPGSGVGDFAPRTRKMTAYEKPPVPVAAPSDPLTRKMTVLQRPATSSAPPPPSVAPVSRPPPSLAADTDPSVDKPPVPSGPIHTLPIVGDRVGKYVVDRVIGSGGMGLVVSARNEALGEVVAIKLLRPKAAGDKVHAERFAREARAIVKIKSEHVVRVLDAATLESGSPYIVMEYLVGKDLAQILRAEGPLEPMRAADLMLQVCEAVASAHAVSVVHRDLKPSNFFVTQRPDGTPLVKVLDFGIAKAIGQEGIVDHNLTETQAVFGSPTYMSPEQIRSAKHVDSRSDVWSLGIAFYEMLTGKLPFAADNVAGLLASIIADPPYFPRAFAPNLPEALEELLLECLAKNPQERIQSAADLAFRIAPFATPSVETQSLVDGIDRLARAAGQTTTTGPKLPLSLPAAPVSQAPGRLPPGSTSHARLSVPPPPQSQSQSHSHSGLHPARVSAPPPGSTGMDLSAEAVPGRSSNVVPIAIGLAAALVVIVGGGAFYLGRRASPVTQVTHETAPSVLLAPPPPPAASPTTSEPAPTPAPPPTTKPSATTTIRKPSGGSNKHAPPAPKPSAAAPAPKATVDPTNDRF